VIRRALDCGQTAKSCSFTIIPPAIPRPQSRTESKIRWISIRAPSVLSASNHTHRATTQQIDRGRDGHAFAEWDEAEFWKFASVRKTRRKLESFTTPASMPYLVSTSLPSAMDDNFPNSFEGLMGVRSIMRPRNWEVRSYVAGRRMAYVLTLAFSELLLGPLRGHSSIEPRF